MKLNIFNKTRGKIDRVFCKKVVATIVKIVGKGLEASLVFVSEKEIQKLNKKYRQKNKATNVLSFSDTKEKNFDQNTKYLGEIFICLSVAQKEAKQYGWSLKHNLARLIVHGALHLLGFDHSNLKNRKKMEGLENIIMCKLNYD